MIKDIISQASTITVLVDGQTTLNNEIKTNILDLLDGAYFVPARAMMGAIDLDKLKQNGVWIDIQFKNKTTYGNNQFTKLTFQLKPKYDFLVFYPNNGDKFNEPISVNLAYKTTEFYKYIIKEVSNNNEK